MSVTPEEWSALEGCVTGDCEPESDEICEAIRKMIDEYINSDGSGHQASREIPKGLKNRYREQTSGEGNGPPARALDWNDARQHVNQEGDVPWPTRPKKSSRSYSSWLRHNDAITRDQEDLGELLQKHEDNNCPDDDLPPDAEAWAKAPLPTPAEWVEKWRNNNNMIGLEDPRMILDLVNPMKKLRLAGQGARWLTRQALGRGRAPGSFVPAY